MFCQHSILKQKRGGRIQAILMTLALFCFGRCATTDPNKKLVARDFTRLRERIVDNLAAMIQHPWDNQYVLLASKHGVYKFNWQTNNRVLITGSAYRGYKEDFGPKARFMVITDVVAGPYMNSKQILIADYGAGCIRKIDLDLKGTQQIYGSCSTSPERMPAASIVRVTAIIQQPNDKKLYYIVDQQKLKSLSLLSTGSWYSTTIERLKFHPTAMFWRKFFLYFVTPDSIWKRTLLRTSPGATRVGKWENVNTMLSSGISYQNRWLVATDSRQNLLRAVDEENNETSVLCSVFAEINCELRKPVAIIEHPAKNNTYFIAGNDMHEVEVTVLDKEKEATKFQRASTTTEGIISRESGGTSATRVVPKSKDVYYAALAVVMIVSLITAIGFIALGIWIAQECGQVEKKKKKVGLITALIGNEFDSLTG